jgi:hypothetical protein
MGHTAPGTELDSLGVTSKRSAGGVGSTKAGTEQAKVEGDSLDQSHPGSDQIHAGSLIEEAGKKAVEEVSKKALEEAVKGGAGPIAADGSAGREQKGDKAPPSWEPRVTFER